MSAVDDLKAEVEQLHADDAAVVQLLADQAKQINALKAAQAEATTADDPNVVAAVGALAGIHQDLAAALGVEVAGGGTSPAAAAQPAPAAPGADAVAPGTGTGANSAVPPSTTGSVTSQPPASPGPGEPGSPEQIATTGAIQPGGGQTDTGSTVPAGPAQTGAADATTAPAPENPAQTTTVPPANPAAPGTTATGGPAPATGGSAPTS